MPLDQYLDNVRSIVQHVRRIGANATVIITPPPIYEPDRLIDRQKKHGVSDRTALSERTNEMTGTYSFAGASPAGLLRPLMPLLPSESMFRKCTLLPMAGLR